MGGDATILSSGASADSLIMSGGIDFLGMAYNLTLDVRNGVNVSGAIVAAAGTGGIIKTGADTLFQWSDATGGANHTDAAVLIGFANSNTTNTPANGNGVFTLA
jgi:hypothetical protein